MDENKKQTQEEKEEEIKKIIEDYEKAKDKDKFLRELFDNLRE